MNKRFNIAYYLKKIPKILNFLNSFTRRSSPLPVPPPIGNKTGSKPIEKEFVPKNT